MWDRSCSSVHVAVISSGRPHRVPVMESLCAPVVPVWYVGSGESTEYLAAGAGSVVEAGGLCRARNLALEAAGAGNVCVQVSDDLRRLGWANGKKAADVVPLDFVGALDKLLGALETTQAFLAGAAPTANPFYASPRINDRGFVVGDLVAVRVDDLRWDEDLPLKEDYDFTLAHLSRHGAVARVDQLMAEFVHRSNPGGAVAYRTESLEQAAIARLMAKWPNRIRPNPRRANEVLLRWR